MLTYINAFSWRVRSLTRLRLGRLISVSTSFTLPHLHTPMATKFLFLWVKFAFWIACPTSLMMPTLYPPVISQASTGTERHWNRHRQRQRMFTWRESNINDAVDEIRLQSVAEGEMLQSTQNRHDQAGFGKLPGLIENSLYFPFGCIQRQSSKLMREEKQANSWASWVWYLHVPVHHWLIYHTLHQRWEWCCAP